MEKAAITIEDVLKLDVRLCEITAAERVPKTDKLLKLTINTGFDVRTAITNIGSQFEPEQLVGKHCPFVLNLAPAVIRGIETRAMIVAATNSDKSVYLFEGGETGAVIW